jgi:putative membrane protein
VRRLLLPAALLVMAAPAHAHGGSHDGWAPDWTVAFPLLLFAGLYAVGASRLWARSTLGRGALRRDSALFAVGWLALAGAVASPLHEAGEHSFTLHMIEHEIIMLLASLLIVAARPGPALLWGFPAGARKAVASVGRGAGPAWRLISDPVAATLLQALALIGWHMPALFDRALEAEGWHVAQHLSFLFTALLFWWAMAHGRSGRRGWGTSALCLFVTSLIGGALGALMAFSASPWYAPYAALGMTPTGLSPAEDQQLAGLVMWIPGGMVHAGAALWFLYKWLMASEVAHAVPAQ